MHVFLTCQLYVLRNVLSMCQSSINYLTGMADNGTTENRTVNGTVANPKDPEPTGMLSDRWNVATLYSSTHVMYTAHQSTHIFAMCTTSTPLRYSI